MLSWKQHQLVHSLTSSFERKNLTYVTLHVRVNVQIYVRLRHQILLNADNATHKLLGGNHLPDRVYLLISWNED